MPPREIAGPAGRLEAMLEEPAAAGSIGRDGRVSPGHPGGLRAAVVFAHPLTSQGGTMHTKVVYQAAKALSRIGCAVLRFNFRGAGASEGTFSNGPGEQDDFRAALDYMAAQYPGAPLWAAGMSFGAWVALSVGADDPRVSTLIGIAPPVTRYDFSAVERSAQAEVFHPGRVRRDLLPEGHARVLRARRRAEGAGRHRRRRSSVRRQGRPRSPTRSRICWGIGP